jgi:hypothetical protein
MLWFLKRTEEENIWVKVMNSLIPLGCHEAPHFV